MGQFLLGCDILKGLLWGPLKWALWILTHLQHFKGHMALTYFIKNQSAGVA